uniref:Uncharacterized protein n=1 Tax=Ciona savignyi TaxID=51511 RepID=H2Z0B6_CIOSA
TDFSEHESKPNGELLQFAIRFKTAEIAASFLSCIEDGREAHAAGKLLDPVSINNEHEAENSDVQHTSVDTESEPNKATPEQKSPVKSSKPLFSFANLDSPFGLKNKPMFNDLAFGTPKSQASGPAGKYNFDASSISFNFGSTSTPATTAPPMFKQPALMNPKPSASKSLFGSGCSRFSIWNGCCWINTKTKRI